MCPGVVLSMDSSAACAHRRPKRLLGGGRKALYIELVCF